MISNERPSPFGNPPHSGGGKPASSEETLETLKIQVERKTFIFTLRENPRGRFLRITEDVSGRRDSIIIPSTGLEDFRKQLDQIIQASDQRPLPES